MITDEQLNLYRLEGVKVRVIRDAEPKNDVLGIVVAWNEQEVLIRKQNRKVLQLSRSYRIQPADQPRDSSSS
ncbi:hypothetical protein DUZ99_08385 [Xylanibacillus composti]|uniref:hypothetical protein n=1 Tax=Xylanibacillus composti TaxID=1572762 RepID=UPI001BCD67B7|nr:hypothetical protein [Xylanibacillus composti]MDT9725011.1 hypothetical protein [Xylanibacillus composti]